MKNRITKIIDEISATIIVFILSFVWLRYYLKNLFMVIILSLAITACIYIGLKLILSPRNAKRNLTRTEEKEKEKIINTLIFSPLQEVINFLFEIFKFEESGLIKKNTCLSSQNHTFVPIIKNKPLDKEDLAKAVAIGLENETTTLTIIASSISTETKRLAETISGLVVKFIDGDKLYSLTQKHGKKPTKMIEFKKQKFSFKELISYALDKKRMKGYLFTGILLIFTSFLTPFKIYYIVIGSVALVLAILCMLSHKFIKA